jgi:two-component system, OmpR family, response regulator
LTKILVVEDDKNLRDILEYNLTREGYTVVTAQEGPEGIRLAYDEKPDLVVLDLMLPGVHGYDVCRAIRKQLTVPILMLSAREDEIDKVLGLELGADDYMTKPFSLRELLARIHAMLRRGEMLRNEAQPAAANTSNGATTGTVTAPAAVSLGDLTVDIGRRQVTRRGKAVEMKPKEFDLLAFLAQNPQQVFSRDVLLDRVWGYDFIGGTRTVDVHVRWLRSKLEEDPSNPRIIQTVYGVGYKLSDED